jgi:hypothetical protein
MDNSKQQLVDFIKSQLSAGTPEPTLTSVLKAQGWTDADCSEALQIVKSTNQSIPPAPASPSIPGNITGAPITNPVQTNASSGSSPLKGVAMFVVILLIVLLGGGGAWGYFNYVAPDPQKTVNKSLSNLVSSIQDKGLFESRSSVEVEVRGNIPQLQSGESTMNIGFDGRSAVDVKNNKMSADLSFNMNLDAGPSMNVNIDGSDFISIVSTGDRQYFKINKIPTGLTPYTSMLVTPDQMDFIENEVINKWIMIDGEQLETLSTIAPNSGFESLATSLNNRSNTATSSMSIIQDLLDANVIVVVEVLPSETIDGQSAFHYKVKIDKEGLKNFVSVTGEKNGVDQAEIDSLKADIDEAFEQFEKELLANGLKVDFDIYISRFSKVPIKFAVNVDASNMKDLESSGVDKATVVIDGSYSFPSSLNIEEPRSYDTMLNMITKIGLVFGPTEK